MFIKIMVEELNITSPPTSPLTRKYQLYKSIDPICCDCPAAYTEG
jgi:hypothetical protein